MSRKRKKNGRPASERRSGQRFPQVSDEDHARWHALAAEHERVAASASQEEHDRWHAVHDPEGEALIPGSVHRS